MKSKSRRKCDDSFFVVWEIFGWFVETLSASQSLGTSPIGEAGFTDAVIIYLCQIGSLAIA